MEDAVMSDLYVDRIADLRRRFATGLSARIDRIETAIQHSGNVSPDVLEQAHRDAHNLCGVGATLGYINTGTAARPVEQILLAAIKARRTHTSDESLRLRAAIALLRSTAAAEMVAGSQ
jgi:chemotaxis protein histidine kinase CheA